MSTAQPEYGERLLAHTIAQIARDQPDRKLYMIPKNPRTYATGSRVVTYRDFERAVDRLAWWIGKNIGKGTPADTLAYIGPNDIRYFMLNVAVPKARYALLLTSPRNSVRNHLHLIDTSSCRVFLKAASTNVDHIANSCPTPLRVLDIPEMDELLMDEEVPEYPFDFTYNDIENDVSIILHSSGSTGQVKPIPVKHSYLAAYDRQHNLRYDGTGAMIDRFPKDWILATMPFFHGAALLTTGYAAVWYGIPAVIYPPDAPVSLAGILECIKLCPVRSAMVAPSTIEEISRSPEALRTVEKLERLCYSGGGVADAAADTVAERTALWSYFGASEHGLYPVFPTVKGDHMYCKLDLQQSGIEFRHVFDDLSELYFVRHEGPQYNHTFGYFPDKKEVGTSDLWKQHPTKPDLWKHAGRADDLIVLSNGEKVSPSLMVDIVGHAPEVHGVVLYGAKRFEIAALIEPDIEVQGLTHDELLSRLIPYIDAANKQVPGHAKLVKERVVFTSPEKPMIRTPKGTIVHKVTLNAYELELDEIYSKDLPVEYSGKPFLRAADEEQTIEVLSEVIGKIGELPSVDMDQDFFQAGVDSLQVITLVRHLRVIATMESAPASLDLINTALVYANPTVRSLAKALHGLGQELDSEANLEAHYAEVESMIAKYTALMPKSSGDAVPAEKFSVILTGSTGSLGSYLLDTLLADPRVVQIYCLNRSIDGYTKQLQSTTTRGLSTEWGERVHFFHAELSQPRLGLDQESFDKLTATTTHIIHNAWPVNFNLPLRTFEPHVHGVRRLVELAATAPHRPIFLFESSVSSAMNYGALHNGAAVPETEIDEVRAALPQGYAASKFAAERVLAAAARESCVPVAIVHVGQMAGSVDKGSVWGRQEWFPGMVISSQHLGALPSSLGKFNNITFVPMDWGAAILWELATGAEAAAGGLNYYNMVNPTPRNFRELLPALVDALEPMPEVVPYEEWVRRLKESDMGPDTDLERNPAVKLLDFFSGGLETAGGEAADSHATDRAKKASVHMTKLEGVKPEWMRAWALAWGLGAGGCKLGQ